MIDPLQPTCLLKPYHHSCPLPSNVFAWSLENCCWWCPCLNPLLVCRYNGYCSILMCDDYSFTDLCTVSWVTSCFPSLKNYYLSERTSLQGLSIIKQLYIRSVFQVTMASTFKFDKEQEICERAVLGQRLRALWWTVLEWGYRQYCGVEWRESLSSCQDKNSGNESDTVCATKV